MQLNTEQTQTKLCNGVPVLVEQQHGGTPSSINTSHSTIPNYPAVFEGRPPGDHCITNTGIQ